MKQTQISSRNSQQGAALVVGLMLLVVITVLAISGMNTATTELALVRNDQAYEDAFQAAETGIEMALSQGQFATGGATTMTQTPSSYQNIATTIQFEDSTMVPDKAFSLGVGSGIAAYHFQATSQAEMLRDPGNTTDRDSSAVHTQAFYVVGPEMSAL
ncbi:MAG: pilus assembly PilX N-terminal domain-containing protein [Gammaproteobacteria bacterium]|nr:pilus assembly PilX N-terminal domain-containing protein [Gammaproteobacteria bacterium]MDH5617422.1 pilus assembly PilX N-terminal domain-containing protein [Gammaproteobacteria bacterium]